MANKILSTIPLVSSAILVEKNVKLLRKKNKKSKDIIGQGVENIIGASLISEMENFV